jgi:Rrf2 family protein
MLSTTAEYALRIMIFITEAGGESVTGERIAEATKVPADYAINVLQLLRRAGLVHAQRGRGGGFRLDCDPTKTTLLDVVDVIDPLERIERCPLGREAHRRKLCPLHQRLDEIIELLRDSLEEMTLQGVVDGAPGPVLCREPGVGVRVSTSRSKTRKGARGRRPRKPRR